MRFEVHQHETIFRHSINRTVSIVQFTLTSILKMSSSSSLSDEGDIIYVLLVQKDAKQKEMEIFSLSLYRE